MNFNITSNNDTNPLESMFGVVRGMDDANVDPNGMYEYRDARRGKTTVLPLFCKVETKCGLLGTKKPHYPGIPCITFHNFVK